MDDQYDELAFPESFAAAGPGKVGFVALDRIQSSFGEGQDAKARRRAQEKLLGCAYYGGGNMHGIRKLYDKVRNVRVDRGQPLGAGDRVKIKGASEVHTVVDSTDGVLTLKRRSTGKKLLKRYARDELTLVHGITRDDVAEFLARQEVHQLSRRPKRVKDFRPIVPRARRAILQLDLIGPMNKESECRELYALIVVDVLTRKAWAAALRQKTAGQTGAAFARLLPGLAEGDAFDRVPRTAGAREVLLSSDNGTEFSEAGFLEPAAGWARANGVRFRQVFGIPGAPNSQAYVERANQSIKGILYRMLHAHGNRCFASFLDRATAMYNSAVHSAVGMSPERAEEQQGRVRRQLMERLKRQPERSYAQEQRARLRPGDPVRVLQLKTAIQHRYYNNWRDPVFRVARVHEPRSARDVLRYTLEPLRPGDPSERLIRSGTADKPGPFYKYKRNMLLRLPSETAEPPPAEPVTFKKWCQQCEADCMDYSGFLAKARAQKKQASKERQGAKARTAKEAVEEYDQQVLATRRWQQVPFPEESDRKNLELERDRGTRRVRLLAREIGRAGSFAELMPLANEFAHEFICLENQLSKTQLEQATGRYQAGLERAAKRFEKEDGAVGSIRVRMSGKESLLREVDGFEKLFKRGGLTFLAVLKGAMLPWQGSMQFVKPSLVLYASSKCAAIKRRRE